jgi:hypothetical protein
MSANDLPTPDYARNMRLIGHSNQGGRADGVQLMVHRGYAYVGHMFSRGFSIIDVMPSRATILATAIWFSGAAEAVLDLGAIGLELLTRPEPPDLLTSVTLVRAERPTGRFSRRQWIFHPENLDLLYSRLEWRGDHVHARYPPAYPNELFQTGEQPYRRASLLAKSGCLGRCVKGLIRDYRDQPTDGSLALNPIRLAGGN